MEKLLYSLWIHYTIQISTFMEHKFIILKYISTGTFILGKSPTIP